MRLLDFFKKHKNETTDHRSVPADLEHQNKLDTNSGQGPDLVKAPDIPESIFVEYQNPNTNARMETNESEMEVYNLNTLYRYLEQNLEKKGFEDALTTPDTSYMNENINFLQNELNLIISKVKTYYKNYIRQIDYHIDTRRRNEMIEVVDELLMQKANVEDEMRIVASIEEDSKKGNGITQNVILSYKRGFKNGFAAITYGTIFNKKN